MPRQPSLRLSWLEPASFGGLSPMQLLVAWLSRHYATYTSSTTKVEMLEELCQGMKDAGYPGCTVHAIRSKIDSLRREARRKRIGDHRHSQAFQQFEQSLMAIFALEVKVEPTVQDGSRNAPIVVAGDESDGVGGGEYEVKAAFYPHVRHHKMLASNRSPNVTEIRRRFELLCARHALEQEGVAMEIIDRMLPLPED